MPTSFRPVSLASARKSLRSSPVSTAERETSSLDADSQAGARPARVVGPDVAGFREYLSDSESTAVRVYRFSSERSATSAQQEMLRALRATPVDGSRIEVIRNGDLVFWVQGSVVPPNHPRAAEAYGTFDADIAALTPP